jgi:hypothetical protein
MVIMGFRLFRYMIIHESVRNNPARWQICFTIPSRELDSILYMTHRGLSSFLSFFLGFIWEILLPILIESAPRRCQVLYYTAHSVILYYFIYLVFRMSASSRICDMTITIILFYLFWGVTHLCEVWTVDLWLVSILSLFRKLRTWKYPRSGDSSRIEVLCFMT